MTYSRSCRSRFFTVVWDSSKKDTRLNVNKDGTVVTVVSGTLSSISHFCNSSFVNLLLL